jgi:hypothetical protein
MVECRDLDEAIAIATRFPTLRAGGSIEVRPVLATSGTGPGTCHGGTVASGSDRLEPARR